MTCWNIFMQAIDNAIQTTTSRSTPWHQMNCGLNQNCSKVVETHRISHRYLRQISFRNWPHESPWFHFGSRWKDDTNWRRRGTICHFNSYGFIANWLKMETFLYRMDVESIFLKMALQINTGARIRFQLSTFITPN